MKIWQYLRNLWAPPIPSVVFNFNGSLYVFEGGLRIRTMRCEILPHIKEDPCYLLRGVSEDIVFMYAIEPERFELKIQRDDEEPILVDIQIDESAIIAWTKNPCSI